MAGSSNFDPYKVLGVARTASSKDIQKQYRQLCLKLHPDKNGHLSSKQKKRAEEKFKQVQEAYSLIGDDDSRRNYDTQQAFGYSSSSRSSSSTSHSASSPYGTDPVAEAFFRAFQQGPGRRTFYFGTAGGPRFGVRTPFPTPDAASSFMPANLSFKSIYVQKVPIPLEELYRGISNWKFHLVDNWWTRWRAAFRGKIAYLSFYQAVIYSFPMLRTSKFLALTIGMAVAHATLPKPDPSQIYETSLQKGAKGGKTKVKFSSTKFGQPEVIFEIVEAPHEVYTRKGNDLHTDLIITPQEAELGCTKSIPSLENDRETIDVTIRPKQVQTSGDTVRIAGKGWPIRNAPNVYHHGDIVVRVLIRNKRRRARKKSS